jgi:hypothetical protein
VVLTLPPGNDLGFTGWWHAVCCAECARNTQHAAAVAAREGNPRCPLMGVLGGVLTALIAHVLEHRLLNPRRPA